MTRTNPLGGRTLSRRALAATGAAILAVAMLAAPAGATPGAAGDRTVGAAQPTGTLPAGFTSWNEVFAVQDKLNAAAEKIVSTNGDGYAGIVAAPQNRDLRLYWKGTPSASVRQLISGLGVPVQVKSAKYSEREMLAEAKRLSANASVRSVGPEVDGSGLTINVTAAAQTAIQAGRGLAATARLPLHLQSDGTPSPLRQNDFSPYWGGARYTSPGGGCTTGFAIFWSGLDHMLTAAHCGNNGQIAIDGGGNPAVDTMGNFFNENSGRDTIMINTPSQGFTYVGAFNNNTGVDVVGAASDFVGNLVCTNGSRTGQHCGIPVTHVNQSDNGFFPLTRSAYPTNQCAGARGDSGGPVVTFSGSTAIGRGTISTGRPGQGNVVCPNAPVSDSTNIVYYAPLLRPAGGPTVGSLQFYGASIL